MRNVLFLAASLTLLGCQVPPKTASERLPFIFDWDPQPKVHVCSTAPVTVDAVRWAATTWANHGAPRLEVVSSYCLTRNEPFVVYLDAPSLDEYREYFYPEAVGITSTWANSEGQIVGADIRLLNDDTRVLLHEFGHIWFPDHVEGKHVMAPHLEDFGFNFDGLERAFR